MEGGAVVPLGVDVDRGAANWGEDDGIVVVHYGKGLARIPSGGGAPKPVTEVANGESNHNYPQTLSGGKAVLFVA